MYSRSFFELQWRFAERVATISGMAGLARCFPFQALAVDTPIAVFDGFYRARWLRQPFKLFAPLPIK